MRLPDEGSRADGLSGLLDLKGSIGLTVSELKTENVDQGPPAGDELTKLPEEKIVPMFDLMRRGAADRVDSETVRDPDDAGKMELLCDERDLVRSQREKIDAAVERAESIRIDQNTFFLNAELGRVQAHRFSFVRVDRFIPAGQDQRADVRMAEQVNRRFDPFA